MIRTAIIGIGGKGFKGWALDGVLSKGLTHVGAVLETPNMELVAISDTDIELTGKFVEWKNRQTPSLNRIEVFNDTGKLLTDISPDAVIIATPPETHLKVARHVAMFESTKAVLLEKPIASTPEEGRKIVDYYKKMKIPLIINQTRRWSESWGAVRDMLKQYGECFHVVAYCNGETIDTGVHMADVINMTAPGAHITYCNLYQEYSMNKYEPYLLFELEYFCKNGVLRISDNGQRVTERQKRTRDGGSTYKNLDELSAPFTFNLNLYNSDMEKANLRAVAELAKIASGKRKKPTCSGVMGLKALEDAIKYTGVEP